jgi:CTP synthase (UTP-ammonia lyase)
MSRRSAHERDGNIRIELSEHPFFVAKLFQPERSAVEGRGAPLIRAFVYAAMGRLSV